MNPPIAQSRSGTSHIPHAKLRADQGTTPTNRNTVKRTHIGVFLTSSVSFSSTGDVAGVPSNADRVRERARGKRWDITGARGLERRVLHREPMVVKVVWRSVAEMGSMTVPARMFVTADPGTDHAFFQMLVTMRTATTCARPEREEEA